MNRIACAFARITRFAPAGDRGPHVPFGSKARLAARVAGHASVLIMLMVGVMAYAPFSVAQAPVADVGAAPPIPAAELDTLVGPIALYPDDLVALVLPASTYPVEIVQADRFLEQKKKDASLKINENWHDPVKALMNYPEVIKKMSTDLDWTISLGEAVVADQGAVLEAVQRFRRQTQAAGQLKSDDKQVVVVEKEVIKIVPADPQVIYVPQYNPTTVVVSGGYPSYGYYPAPYPSYYYPYPPGAALATGLIWGAAISAVWHGGHYEAHYGGGGNNNININRETNIERGDRERNVDRGDRERNVDRGGNRSQSGQSSAWRSEKKPGQVSGTTGRANGTQRVGDTQARGGAGGGSAATGARQQGGQRASSAGSLNQGSRGTQAGRGGGDAFSGYGSARDAQANSSRGASSRQSSVDTRTRSAQTSGRSGGGGMSGGGRGGGGGGGFSRGGGGRGGGRR